jgi:hypothetical protein
MQVRWITPALAAAMLLAAPSAWADKIALLPSRGGADPSPRSVLDSDLARGLTALGHTVIAASPSAAGVTDAVADTLEEYRAVGAATHADWVLVGAVEPAVATARVELTACLVRMGRVESVAREVNQTRTAPEVQEMLAVLVRPEGIGAGELPWEKAPRPPPPAPPPAEKSPPPVVIPPPAPPAAPPAPPIEGRVGLSYPTGAAEVWPAYSGGKRGLVSVGLGFSAPAARPGAAKGSGSSFVSALRAGYAIGDAGIEPFAEFGGNLAGPRALWLNAGARWMFSPFLKRGNDGLRRGLPLFIGPELTAGLFVRLGTSGVTAKDGTTYSAGADAHPVLGLALDGAFALSRSFQLEAQLGNLRWVPTGEGSILLLGATLGGALRF